MEYEIKLLKQLMVAVILILLAILGIQSYISNITVVYQCSMNPTLEEGDLLLTEKLSYMLREPEAGEIIIMLKEQPEGIKGTRIGITLQDYLMKLQEEESRTRYVKRVVAVPGDTIDIQEGHVYINDEILTENYIQGKTEQYTKFYPLEIPEGYVFVLGDNRENSLDSRTFGMVPIEKIESRVVMKMGHHTP